MKEEPQQPDQNGLTVGEILRRTRVHYDQSLEDIERALHIRVPQLQALEAGDYASLPGRVYVIGFIRAYAEYLGLNGDKMVELYKAQTGGITTPKEKGPQASLNYAVMASDTKMPQFWQVGVSVAGVLVVLILWWSMSGGSDKPAAEQVPIAPKQEVQAEIAPPPVTPSAAAPATSPMTAPQPEQLSASSTSSIAPAATPATPMTAPEAAEPSATPGSVATSAPETTPSPAKVQDAVSAEIAAQAAAAQKQQPAAATKAQPAQKTAAANTQNAETQKGIILNIRQNSWVEIRSRDGKSIVSRVLRAGDRYYVPDRPDLLISLGNAGGVDFEVEGQKLNPVGEEGEVKRNVPLDSSYLRHYFGKNTASGTRNGNQ